MTLNKILTRFEKEADATKAKSLNRFGVEADKAFGVTMPFVRRLAKEIGTDQGLAIRLWDEGHHELKLLASLIADPQKFTIELADQWVSEIYSWDVCDQLCINLLSKVSYAWELPGRYAPQEPEFTRRVGIVMVAVLGVHHKKVADKEFLQFIPILKEYSTDPRNFVKKAVNWAIRQMGKRSAFLHSHMVTLCHELLKLSSKPATWSAKDALKELESEKIKERMGL